MNIWLRKYFICDWIGASQTSSSEIDNKLRWYRPRAIPGDHLFKRDTLFFLAFSSPGRHISPSIIYLTSSIFSSVFDIGMGHFSITLIILDTIKKT